MARRPNRYTEEDFESLEGRASKTEQKKAVQRMAALGEELAKQGHEVYVIASSYTHLLREPKHIKNDFFIEKLALNFSYIWVKLPTYEGAHSSQRIINEFLFSFKIIGLKNKI